MRLFRDTEERREGVEGVMEVTVVEDMEATESPGIVVAVEVRVLANGLVFFIEDREGGGGVMQGEATRREGW